MQFLREEREERKYIQRGRTKNKKKRNRSISRTRKFTPSPEYYKKRWHSLYKSTPPRRQKRRPPPRRRPRSRRCARVSFARVVFRPDSDFFFSSLSPKMVLSSSKGGEKTRPKNEPKKRNIRIFASLRIRPQKPPFRRRQTRASNAEMYREYIGARFDAAASVARRSRGPFLRRLCSKNKSRKRFAKFLSSGEKHLAHEPTGRLMGKNEREKRFCFWSDFDLFFWSFRLKKEKKYTQTLTISFSFSFTQTLNNVL